MPYKKYKNKYGWCTYPFENDCFGYCWGYASNIDKKATREDVLKSCNKKVEEETNVSKNLGLKIGDYWCEFYKPRPKMKHLKHILNILRNFWHRFWYENPYCRW